MNTFEFDFRYAANLAAEMADAALHAANCSAPCDASHTAAAKLLEYSALISKTAGRHLEQTTGLLTLLQKKADMDYRLKRAKDAEIGETTFCPMCGKLVKKNRTKRIYCSKVDGKDYRDCRADYYNAMWALHNEIFQHAEMEPANLVKALGLGDGEEIKEHE